MASKRALLCCLLAAMAFATLRLAWLDADPPGYILDAFITDEGWYAQAARNHALFGRWIMDEHNVALALLAPLLTASTGDKRRTAKETAFVAGGLASVAAVAMPFLLPFREFLLVESGREGSVIEGGGPPAGLALPLILGLHSSAGVLPGFWVGRFPILADSGLATARLH